jgi:hypothetical protein
MKGILLIRFLPKSRCDWCYKECDNEDLYVGEICSEGGILICKECLNKKGLGN